ncbi:MAG: transposase [Rhodospirillales bacterium]|nr:transposase [Rhodospirillales bacterium]
MKQLPWPAPTDPSAADPAPDDVEHRQIVYRVLFDQPATARRLAAVAGACRFVWNEMLDQQAQVYDIARLCGAQPPAPTFFTLGKAFTQLRRVTPWLQAMPYAPVRYALKYQADAWRRFFQGEAGRPRFKRRGRDSVTIPQDVRIRDGKLYFPKIGWLALRRRGGNPYPDAEPVQAVLKRVNGKWMATVCYAVAAPARPDDGAVTGVDMNVGQVAASDGRHARIVHASDSRRLEARVRRYQRRLARQRRGSRRRERTRRRLARTQRRIAQRRRDWQHQVSRSLAGGTVVVEALRTRAMTASAKGTMAAPGRHVRQKAGLNREILATGWSGLRAMLAYKAARLVAVDPAHTSRTCAACGHADAASRRSQSSFECVACGHADHADLNAARNIRRRGMALLHGEECSGLPTPVTRETDRRLAA